MRKVRCLYFLMSLFSLISLICIGFSSWTISGTGAEVMGTGGITASPVYDVDEYAKSNPLKCFTFNKDGFLSTNEAKTENPRYGVVIATYTNVDLTKLPSGKKLVAYFRGTTQNGSAMVINNYSIGSLCLAACKIEYYATSTLKLAESTVYAASVSATLPGVFGSFTLVDDGSAFLNNSTHAITLNPMIDDGNGGKVLDTTVNKIVITYYMYASVNAIEDSTEFYDNIYPILTYNPGDDDIDTSAGDRLANFYSHARIE